MDHHTPKDLLLAIGELAMGVIGCVAVVAGLLAMWWAVEELLLLFA